MNSIEVSSFDQWWWLEIKTAIPECIYYFGPFFSKQEAEISQYGYIEDLWKEEVHGITVEIKRINPKELTIEVTNKQESSFPSAPGGLGASSPQYTVIEQNPK